MNQLKRKFRCGDVVLVAGFMYKINWWRSVNDKIVYDMINDSGVFVNVPEDSISKLVK